MVSVLRDYRYKELIQDLKRGIQSKEVRHGETCGGEVTVKSVSLSKGRVWKISDVVIVPLKLICMRHGPVLTTPGLLDSESATPVLHPRVSTPEQVFDSETGHVVSCIPDTRNQT